MGSDLILTDLRIDHIISIHAPRVGSDLILTDLRIDHIISIHAPRVGSDGIKAINGFSNLTFQSTLPVWGATSLITATRLPKFRFQSTLPVWGATLLGIL